MCSCRLPRVSSNVVVVQSENFLEFSPFSRKKFVIELFENFILRSSVFLVCIWNKRKLDKEQQYLNYSSRVWKCWHSTLLRKIVNWKKRHLQNIRLFDKVASFVFRKLYRLLSKLHRLLSKLHRLLRKIDRLQMKRKTCRLFNLFWWIVWRREEM